MALAFNAFSSGPARLIERATKNAHNACAAHRLQLAFQIACRTAELSTFRRLHSGDYIQGTTVLGVLQCPFPQHLMLMQQTYVPVAWIRRYSQSAEHPQSMAPKCVRHKCNVTPQLFCVQHQAGQHTYVLQSQYITARCNNQHSNNLQLAKGYVFSISSPVTTAACT